MKSEFENEMKLEFISKSTNEAFARITVAAFASQLEPTIEEISRHQISRYQKQLQTALYTDMTIGKEL